MAAETVQQSMARLLRDAQAAADNGDVDGAAEIASAALEDWRRDQGVDLNREAEGHEFEVPSHPSILSTEEATAIVAYAFDEDYDAGTLLGALKRLGDWVDGSLGLTPTQPQPGEEFETQAGDIMRVRSVPPQPQPQPLQGDGG